MSQLVDVFLTHYARPAYLASLQVMLNMDHDPEPAPTSARRCGRSRSDLIRPVRRLLREALGPAANKPDLATTIFLVIRGFAFSQQLLDSMAYDTVAPKQDRGQRHRRLLTEILTPYVEIASETDR